MEIVNRLLVALSVVLTMLGIAALTTTLRLKREVAGLQNAHLADEERRLALERQLRQAGTALQREQIARPAPSVWPTFELRPGAPRPGSRSPEIAIPPDAALVVLDLIVPASLTADAYRAGLRSAPGDEFWAQSRLTVDSDRRAIRLEIPASALRAGDHELSLQPAPAAAKATPTYYYFSVTRR